MKQRGFGLVQGGHSQQVASLESGLKTSIPMMLCCEVGEGSKTDEERLVVLIKSLFY